MAAAPEQNVAAVVVLRPGKPEGKYTPAACRSVLCTCSMFTCSVTHCCHKVGHGTSMSCRAPGGTVRCWCRCCRRCQGCAMCWCTSAAGTGCRMQGCNMYLVHASCLPQQVQAADAAARLCCCRCKPCMHSAHEGPQLALTKDDQATTSSFLESLVDLNHSLTSDSRKQPMHSRWSPEVHPCNAHCLCC